MRSKLSKSANEIIVAVMRQVPVATKARTFSFRFSDGIGDQVVASAPVQDDPSIHVVWTLAANGQAVFITATDGDERCVADVLARVEDYSARTPLHRGDGVILESDYLKENGRVAMLLLEPRVSNLLRGLPDELVAGGNQYHCHLVVFLSDSEYRTKTAAGLPALLSRFQVESKDLVALRAAEVPRGRPDLH